MLEKEKKELLGESDFAKEGGDSLAALERTMKANNYSWEQGLDKLNEFENETRAKALSTFKGKDDKAREAERQKILDQIKIYRNDIIKDRKKAQLEFDELLVDAMPEGRERTEKKLNSDFEKKKAEILETVKRPRTG